MSDDSSVYSYLKQMEEKNASDLFLTSGKVPHIRVYGKMEPLNKDIISKADIEFFIREYLP